MTVHSCNTAVVGAGCAGLNAADELARAGVDALLIDDGLGGGTSRNAGSDKQTYYKLSLAGENAESVRVMAATFFAGGAHGDLAYAMAALSARSFVKLALLGVPFPQNEWGEYVGYQTDHDATKRATSAGPLTSRLMADALDASVRARGVRRLTGLTLLSVLTDGDGRARGLLLADEKGEFELVNAKNIVACSGGAALVYGKTVYPSVQRGALGALIRAGAEAENLCFWQYGLASTKVKWNVSGSYQQAVPAYTDGQSELLAPYFSSRGDLLDSVFLKGYQWPFDARKRNGSSRVDLAVLRCGRAFLDFTRPVPLDELGEEGRSYLAGCGALEGLPCDRLNAMNAPALAFYEARGIDLRREPLEIAVCAQHMNGGARVDEWWRTSVPGLYAAGECAGAFGAYRPGGSALNETQVGSLRAAQHIAAHTGRETPLAEEAFLSLVAASLSRETRLFSRAPGDGAQTALRETRAEMDACAGAERSVSGMRALLARVNALIASPPAARDALEAAELIDTLCAQRACLGAMLCQAEYAMDAGHVVSDAPKSAPRGEGLSFVTRPDGETRAIHTRPLPPPDERPFEAVWRGFREGRAFGGEA